MKSINREQGYLLQSMEEQYLYLLRIDIVILNELFYDTRHYVVTKHVQFIDMVL